MLVSSGLVSENVNKGMYISIYQQCIPLLCFLLNFFRFADLCFTITIQTKHSDLRLESQDIVKPGKVEEGKNTYVKHTYK